jgi:hypothetical protein
MENQNELSEEIREEVPDEEELGASLSSGSESESLDSEDDEDAYLADEDGSEYKLDMIHPDTVKKSSHNRELLLVCRRVSSFLRGII